MGALPTTQKERWQRGALAGLLAGILASLLMLLLSLTMGSISLPEALGSAIAQSLPLPVFDYLHTLLGGDAKHYLFYIILVGQCLVFALFGGLCNLLADRLNFGQWRDEQGDLNYSVGLMLAFILWLFSGLIFLPLTGSGIFGAQLVTGALNTMFSLAITGIVYGLLFIFLHNRLTWRLLRRTASPDQETAEALESKRIERRSLIRNSLVVLGLGTLGVAAWRFITGSSGGTASTADPQLQSNLLNKYQQKISPPPQPTYGEWQEVPGLSSEVTSNAQFYGVSKNLLSDPSVKGDDWQLMVDGLVSQPFTMSYKELLALPMHKQYESMMCISNEVGGSYMSNALWEGISLKDLLERAGTIKPGATKVVLYAADSYSDSIHLAKALEPTTMVAIKMNGETLPTSHGYPARLLVPGIYGMKHVKWITRIQVVNTDYQGYWQQNGWSDPAPIKMTSRIDTPTYGSKVSAGKQAYIAGVAFSGNKGISQVEVSVDGGKSWQKANLRRPLSALTWVLWELPWQPQAGSYSIVVRATDLQGNVQNPKIAPPLPDGSSGYHTIPITVS
ncbi:molybdopterin-dependent oxidoreductase [Dictyobacter formicarum]|uniref:Molybdopterin-binding protein n=1 Tax=Dictyobacter formicarum TaxID=2778368 RepID=A0ABQ3VKB7_9CHLR|nr:molybdopterin-dependent oxidoreductase [Dictyobacter formicarum]GHO86654.1 molybdopterin-binding protein [Dictyobacter formicarum]